MGFLLASKFSKGLNAIWALVMIVLAVMAYLSIADPPNHIDDLLKNWQQRPIYALKSIPKNESCPFGSETISRVGSWPGTEAGCFCSGNGSLRKGPCAGSDISLGCVEGKSHSVPETSKFELMSWRERILCVWRGGTPQYYAPLYDSETESCPSATDEYGNTVRFKRCGSGLGAHCSEAGLNCPIARMVLQQPGEPTPTGYSFAEYFGDNVVLHYDNDEDATELPIIDLTITKGPVCYEDPGDEQFYGDSDYLLSSKSQTRCNYNDSRYTVIDQIPEAAYFSDNDFEGVSSLPRLNLHTDKNWTFSVRRSVEWLPHCAYGSFSMADVNDHRAPIESIIEVQITELVAVCLICGYLMILDPLLSCLLYNKSEEDINEFDRPLTSLAVIEKMLKLVLLPFTIAGVWILSYHHNWFTDLTARCCSDPLTNATFDFVHYAANDTFVMDWAMFCLNVFILLADSVFSVVVFIHRTKENFR